MINWNTAVGVAQLVERRSVACAVKHSNALNRHRLSRKQKFLNSPLLLTPYVSLSKAVMWHD